MNQFQFPRQSPIKEEKPTRKRHRRNRSSRRRERFQEMELATKNIENKQEKRVDSPHFGRS